MFVNDPTQIPAAYLRLLPPTEGEGLQALLEKQDPAAPRSTAEPVWAVWGWLILGDATLVADRDRAILKCGQWNGGIRCDVSILNLSIPGSKATHGRQDASLELKLRVCRKIGYPSNHWIVIIFFMWTSWGKPHFQIFSNTPKYCTSGLFNP